MSRYRRSTNDLGDDLAYGDLPTSNRWDRDRFESIRVAERDRPGRTDIRISDHIDRRGPGGRYEERDYIEEDHYAAAPPTRLPSRPRRSDRELFGAQDPREVAEMALAPYRPRKSEVERDLLIDIERRREVRDPYPPAPRPGLLRRQSSLDTFDRRPARRYEEDYRLPPNIDIPLPRRPPPPSAAARRMREEDYLEEVRYSDRYPEDYRDVEIVREREITRRNRAPSDVRSRRSEARSEAKSKAKSVKSAKSAKSVSTVSSESSSSSESEDEVSRATSPSPARSKVGRKGKTRMPKRLVKRQVLVNLEYPFIEEEGFYVVTRALGKEQIDEVIRLSEEYSAPEPRTTTYRYDAAKENEHYEALRTEWINPPSIRAPSPTRSTRTRKPSPTRTVRTARSVSRVPSPPRVKEQIIIREQAPAPPPMVQAPAPPAQPLTIYLPDRGRERSEAELKAEIRALEAEQRALRLERETESPARREVLIREQRPEVIIRERPEERRELIVREQRPEEEYQVVEYRPRPERREVEYVERERERERSPPRNVIRVEKDRKGRMALVRSAH